MQAILFRLVKNLSCFILGSRRKVHCLKAMFEYHPDQVLVRGYTVLEGAMEADFLLSDICCSGAAYRHPYTLEIYLELARFIWLDPGGADHYSGQMLGLHGLPRLPMETTSARVHGQISPYCK